MADSDDIKKANEDLSRLLRASIFPGAVSSFPKRSVTQEMLAQAEPNNPEYKCLPPRRPRPLAHRARIPAPSVGASARARSRGSAAVWQPRPAARQSNTARQRTLCVVLSAIRASTLVLCAPLSLSTGIPCIVLAQGSMDAAGALGRSLRRPAALSIAQLRHNCTPPQLPLPNARTLRAGWTRRTLVSSMTSSPLWRRSLRAEICSSRLRRRASDY